ncbi:MAG: hypothetical protein FJY88_03525 [Candidatus Eisenbacteria bacterium]|nr:hypothetical protein [Candidatus Eisenbacteria bacterium]
MESVIGIRREDKNDWERRTPLIPSDVRTLVNEGIRVIVQPSRIRVFSDEEYARAGAVVQESLSPCRVVFAVKEIPTGLIEEKKAYVFFSHVVKGQKHNMPMLQRLLDLKCSLIDYEKVTDNDGKRLIFFGTQAGHAGTIDTLHALGRRLETEGLPSPFSAIRMAHAYSTFVEAKEAIGEVGSRIERDGLPAAISPLVIGVVGYGHVGTGVLDVLDCLPLETIAPRDLTALDLSGLSNRKIYRVLFKEEDMVEPVEPGGVFELYDYYARPERYRGIFARYLPRLSVLVNAAYWDKRYPRVITREDARRLYGGKEPPMLRVIGDISCDIDGGVEFTVKETTPDHPTFVYLPAENKIADGVEGRGPVVMSIDNLPCELPREASEFFSKVLLPFVESITHADLSKPFEADGLPDEIQRAVIAYHGELAPAFGYLKGHLSGKETSR